VKENLLDLLQTDFLYHVSDSDQYQSSNLAPSSYFAAKRVSSQMKMDAKRDSSAPLMKETLKQKEAQIHKLQDQLKTLR
jgi:hypothetical protein